MSMHHLFIVNPAAGKVDATPQIQKRLSEIPEFDTSIYNTTGIGDATRYVREYLSSHSEPVRIYACGGDGTLNEVVNGAVGFPQASIGCYPCGSGNDFVKYYGGKEPFMDIKALLNGTTHSIDLLRVNDRYSINCCHFGFDTSVAKMISTYKRLPFVSGKTAYYLAVMRALLLSMKTQGTLIVDENMLYNGAFLLCTLANASHVGGSYHCAPHSRNDDGLIEVCLVKPVSRLKFISLMGAYQEGTHLENSNFLDVIVYRQAHNIHLTMPDGEGVSLDGEVINGNEFEIQMCPSALSFILPEGISSTPHH